VAASRPRRPAVARRRLSEGLGLALRPSAQPALTKPCAMTCWPSPAVPAGASDLVFLQPAGAEACMLLNPTVNGTCLPGLNGWLFGCFFMLATAAVQRRPVGLAFARRAPSGRRLGAQKKLACNWLGCSCI
jgi:hypothetical protein